MKSFQYNKIKEEGIYEEVFIGAFDGLRNNSYIKERGTMSEQTGLPFTNQDLKRIERKLKNKGHFFILKELSELVLFFTGIKK